jgi:hypothetical protein
MANQQMSRKKAQRENVFDGPRATHGFLALLSGLPF